VRVANGQQAPQSTGGVSTPGFPEQASVGWTRVEGEDGLIEKVIVRSDLFEEYVPTQRIQLGIWLAMLRDALAHGYTVNAITPDEIPPMQSLGVRL
jgi:hypothetical protein